MIDSHALPAPVRTLIAAARPVGTKNRRECSPLSHAERSSLPQFAMRHGMLAWLPAAAAIADADRSGDPAPAEAELVRRHAARSLSGLRELLDLVARFDAAGIPVVALKGPVFSAWIYDNPAVRPFSDLDLLVTEQTRHDALVLLESMGYGLSIPHGAAETIYASIGACPLERTGSTGVDLHWRLAGRRFARVVSADEVLRNAVPLRFGNRQILAPAPTHAAILTLTHAAKHLWYALELPLSVARLMDRADVDWGEVRALAERADAVRPVAAGVRIAAELFGAPIPRPLANDVDTAAVRILCSHAASTLALPPNVFPGRRVDWAVHRLCFGRVTNRIGYDLRRVMEPTYADWEWLPLPRSLTALYVPVRLVRLVRVALTVYSRS